MHDRCNDYDTEIEMPVTKDCGRLYAHRQAWPANVDPPLAELGETTEIEHPWRRGRCLVLRLPFTRRGVALGRWTAQGDEDSNLRQALRGRELDVDAATVLAWDGDGSWYGVDA